MTAGRVPVALRVGVAAAAGLALLVAFPPYDLWWAAPVGVALLALACHGCRPLVGAALGSVTGALYFGIMLYWTGLHVGPMPWLLLSGLQAAYIALLGAASAWVSPLLASRPAWWAPVTGLLWVGQEALRDRTPFGGFPWGRLAFSQGDSPLLRLAAVGGAPLVTFGVAVCGGLLAAALLHARERRAWRRAGALAAAAAAVTLAGLAVPLSEPAGPAVTVAIVQGNVPRMGLDFNAQRRAVLDNHVDGTIRLAERVAAGTAKQPDLVIWPENSSDIDPLYNPDAGARIQQAADAIRAPILVGAVLLDPDPDSDNVLNAGLVWLPGTGAGERYVKRHPVPFAEYVPLRSIARRVSDKVDLVRSDFVAGDRPGVLAVGPARLGDVICFEVAYDSVVRDTVTSGAQLLVVQTNNATFNIAEARQQHAMVRLRAVEHGRHAMMASTVGVSGFVDAHGHRYGSTSFFTPAVVVRELRLGARRTLATRLGPAPEYLLAAGAVAALLAAALVRRARRRAQRSGERAVPTPVDRRPEDGGDRVSEEYPGVGRVLVVIPTYNEAENARPIVERVRAAAPAVDILIADDASPDGTGEIADGLAAADPHVHVLHRSGKQGLGAAYIAGFGWARERNYDAVVEMDADGSHAPEELPTLLDALADADAVLGSRWVRGGKVVNWPFHRLLLSRGGNLYTRIALRIPFRDATGGYRAYRMPVLDKIEIDTVLSQGYCFQVDLAWRAYKSGCRVVEVPITFAERERGASKMSSSIVREALWRVTVWGAQARLGALRRRGRRA